MNRGIRAVALGLALMSTSLIFVDEADARAGRSRSMRGTSVYRSMGDRGVRTDRTWGNPASRPGFQSVPGQMRPGLGVPAQQPSWSQRNPFLSGMLGGLAGSAVWSGISGMFGGHHGGYGSGYGSGYGPGHGYGSTGGGFGILPLLLLLGGGWWLYRKMSRNSQERAVASSGLSGWGRPVGQDGAPSAATFDVAARPVTGFGGQQTLDQGLAAIQLNSPGLTRQGLEDRLSAVFFGIQEAWSAQDGMAFQRLCAPEIAEQFSRDLDEARRHGERNVLKNIVIRRFDMSEAWTEMDREFVTARIQARLIDYVERGGEVIEGSQDDPTDFAETWTFARARGGDDWRLTAIEQA